VVTSLGIVHVRLGEYAAARARFEHSLAIAREVEYSLGMVSALTNLGSACRILGQYSTDHDSVLAACRAQLGESAFAAAWARAAGRPFQEVVEEVLKRFPYTQ